MAGKNEKPPDLEDVSLREFLRGEVDKALNEFLADNFSSKAPWPGELDTTRIVDDVVSDWVALGHSEPGLLGSDRPRGICEDVAARVWSKLVEFHIDKTIRPHLRRKVGGQLIAAWGVEDLVQSAGLRLWQQVCQTGRNYPASYARTIADNVLNDALQKRRNSPPTTTEPLDSISDRDPSIPCLERLVETVSPALAWMSQNGHARHADALRYLLSAELNEKRALLLAKEAGRQWNEETFDDYLRDAREQLQLFWERERTESQSDWRGAFALIPALTHPTTREVAKKSLAGQQTAFAKSMMVGTLVVGCFVAMGNHQPRFNTGSAPEEPVSHALAGVGTSWRENKITNQEIPQSPTGRDFANDKNRKSKNNRASVKKTAEHGGRQAWVDATAVAIAP